MMCAGEPALVCLTGWCSTRTSYAAMVEHTSRRSRSIAIDWRVHGTLPAADGDFGWPQMADDVLAVLDGCGVDRFVPVANAHAGWVARDLAERVPDRVAGMVLINWLVLGAPPPFAAGLAALADLAATRRAADGLTASWLDGHEDVPGLAGQIAEMRPQGDQMWARAGREIAAAYATGTSPLQAFAALAVPPPVRHLYAEPEGPGVRSRPAGLRPYPPVVPVRRPDTPRTHFPTLEQPAGRLLRDTGHRCRRGDCAAPVTALRCRARDGSPRPDPLAASRDDTGHWAGTRQSMTLHAIFTCSLCLMHTCALLCCESGT
jgi:pimeloyl-ACP methyl ester carboxylesterase